MFVIEVLRDGIGAHTSTYRWDVGSVGFLRYFGSRERSIPYSVNSQRVEFTRQFRIDVEILLVRRRKGD
jgi:hypothetical protein